MLVKFTAPLGAPISVNSKLVSYVQASSFGGTMMYFEKGHYVTVSDELDDVIQRLNSSLAQN